MSKAGKATFNVQLDIEINQELLIQAGVKRTTKVGQITQLIQEEKKRRLKKQKS